MFPGLSFADATNGSFSNSERERYRAVCTARFPDAPDISFCQLARRVSYATSLTALSFLVRHVVCYSSCEQVLGVHTRPMVTIVEHLMSRRDGTNEQLKSRAVRPALPTIQLKMSVA